MTEATVWHVGQVVETPVGKATVVSGELDGSKVYVEFDRNVMGLKPWIDAFGGARTLVDSPTRRWVESRYLKAVQLGVRFQPGQVVSTPGALDAFESAGEQPINYLKRHLKGDWGDLGADDKKENELSVKEGFRILSAYHLKDGTKIYVITEADRSYTTFLLPSEY